MFLIPLDVLLLLFHLGLLLLLLLLRLFPMSLFSMRISLLSLTRCIFSFGNLWIIIGLRLRLLLIILLLRPQIMVLFTLQPYSDHLLLAPKAIPYHSGASHIGSLTLLLRKFGGDAFEPTPSRLL